MASPTATRPDRVTGLPPGVSVGPLGRRLVAYLIDAIVPAVLLAVLLASRRGGSGAGVTISLVLLAAYALVVWWMFALRAAGPGMRLMKLQLVGFTNGRPIGWGRYFVRTLVLGLLTVSVVGLLLVLVVLLRHPRYQGWHDLAANAVVIRQRPLAPEVKATRTTSAKVPRDASATQTPPSPSSPTPASSRPAPEPEAVAQPIPAGGGAPAGQRRQGPPALTPAPVRTAGSRPVPDVGSVPAPPVDDDTDERIGSANWVAVLDDGREVAVRGLVLLGRNPAPRPGEEGAQLVKVADESRTVSKSHLALALGEHGVFAIDRDSTNGSVVTAPDGARIRCLPEEAVPVAEGAVVSMGDHWLKLRRD